MYARATPWLFVAVALIAVIGAMEAGSRASSCPNSTLQVSTLYPSGQGFVQGDTLPFVVHVFDSCGAEISNATVSFTLIPIKSASLSFPCTPTTNDRFESDGGWYRCDRGTAGRPKGNYTMNVTATATGYSQGVARQDNAFNLGTPPTLIAFNLSDIFLRRGQGLNITAVFSDADLDSNTVELQASRDLVFWTIVDQTTISGIAVPLTFVENASKGKGRYFLRLRSRDAGGRLGFSTTLDVIVF